MQEALEGINGSLLTVRMHPMHLDMSILGLVIQDQVRRFPWHAIISSASPSEHCSAQLWAGMQGTVRLGLNLLTGRPVPDQDCSSPSHAHQPRG